MKKCPKCGTKNPQENKFCKNCGAPLPEQAEKSKQPVWLITTLTLTIIVLVAVIFFLMGKQNSAKSPSDKHVKTSQVIKKTTKPSQKVTSSSSSNSASSSKSQLNLATQDDKVKAAAVAYYASENGLRSWPKLMMYQANPLVAYTNHDAYNNFNEGSNATMIIPKGTGSGAVQFYTTKGNNVYFYMNGGVSGDDDNGESLREKQSVPLASSNWDEIGNFITAHGGYQTVMALAKNAEINPSN